MKTTKCVLGTQKRRVEAKRIWSEVACRDERRRTPCVHFYNHDLTQIGAWFSYQALPSHLLPIFFPGGVQADECMIDLIACASSTPHFSQIAYEEGKLLDFQSGNMAREGERVMIHGLLWHHKSRIMVKLCLAIFSCLFPIFHLCFTHLSPMFVCYDFLMQWCSSGGDVMHHTPSHTIPLERKVNA